MTVTRRKAPAQRGRSSVITKKRKLNIRDESTVLSINDLTKVDLTLNETKLSALKFSQVSTECPSFLETFFLDTSKTF